MRKLFLLLCTAIFITFVFNTCKTSDDDGVIIQGQVINQQSLEPIANALVQITSPEEFNNVFARSDSAGNYSLGAIEITEVTELEITVSAPDFETLSRSLTVAPEDQITGFNFEISLGEDGDDDDDGDGGVPSGPSGGAASIELTEISDETINITATGGITSSTFTFEVQDSSGNSIDLNNAIDVEFSILSGPGGGEVITPTSARTNEQGLVSATLKSGNAAGVVKIQARIERTVMKIATLGNTRDSNGTNSITIGSDRNAGLGSTESTRNNVKQDANEETINSNQYSSNSVSQEDIVITSEPVAVTIHGGFPDENNFTLSAPNVNFELLDELRVPVTALLGDAFSNPVKPGTAVYFETNNGVIAGSAEGHTNDEGEATVNLNPANFGNATVTATTVNSTNMEIEADFDLIFTTSKALVSFPGYDDNSGIALSAGNNESVDFIVTDQNGNPMAPGTTIEVSTENENLTLSGNTAETLSDASTGGEDITEFSFNVEAGEEFSGSSNIVVTITSSSGVTTTKAIVASTSGGVVSGEPAAPASMQLIELTEETINIAESGGITNTTFTFQVQDSAGRNLDSESAVDVEFDILSNPGGATIIPEVVTTDAQGRAISNLNAGNTAGVVQIEARVAGTNIVSKPVAVTIHGGFPDQDHFTLEPLTETNVEGFDRNGVDISFKVRAGDEFSNPVKPGTAVFFETTGGVIEGSGTGHTDETGFTEVTLFAGNPRPANGQGVVTAKTTDKDGNDITETADFIFSTSKANISTDVTELELASGESQSVSYTVEDLNGNPMAAGTTIEVTAGAGILVSGTTSHTMSNELSPGDNITDFNFNVTATDNLSGSETVTIVVRSPSGTVTTNQDLTVTGTGGGVSGPPSEAAALILESVQHSTINIKETGGTVNTAFTFQVQDSSGRALNSDNPVDVDFEIIQGPGGDEGILPTTATTNSSGRVTSNLFSGNVAGVVRIRASVTRDDGVTIQSTPVAITIHGGFPDLDHFSLAPDASNGAYNFEGWSLNGNRNQINVLLGDEFSNPVKPGTAVYFSSTGGVIEGSGIEHTDEDGEVNVDLISGEPRPDDPETVDGTNFGGRDGLATITASTIDKDNQVIEKSMNVVFSTSSAVVTANPTTFDLDPNGGASFDYTVTDLNGNPMAKGTTIEIEGGADIEVTGSANFTLGNHIFPGPGATEFSFSIRDTDDENNDPADLTISIIVTSPSGNVTTFDGIQGTRRKSVNK